LASSFQILVDGSAAEASFYDQIAAMEVEENLDLPGALQLTLPVTRTDDGELSVVGDTRFRPYANLAVVVTVDGGAAACIFDGYVLSHKLHIERGVTGARAEIWGQDASWLMNLEEKVREWADTSDADVAGSIFAEYGMSPADANSADESPGHPESGHTLMQRATDAQFLRELARRSGKHFRVRCDATAGKREGFFARPDLDGEPVTTLKLNDPADWNVEALDFEWDVMRPTAVRAAQALFDDDDEDGADGGTDDSGLTALDARGLADFAGKPMTTVLTTVVDDAGELRQRAQGVLRDGAFFVRCEGEAELARLGVVLRAGSVVQIEGVGALHSGKYLVWSVRHTIGNESHRMRFVLLRNAMGAPAAGGGGLLGGLGL
jgi:phage protein D